MGKVWYKSKTVLFNLATGIISVGAFFTDHSAILKDYPKAAAVVVGAVGLANIVLRLMTTEPIKV